MAAAASARKPAAGGVAVGPLPFLTADDLWARLPGAPAIRPVPFPVAPAQQRLPEGLSDLERRIARALLEGAQDVDGIARDAEVEAGAALVELLSLELRSVVESLPGRRYRLR